MKLVFEPLSFGPWIATAIAAALAVLLLGVLLSRRRATFGRRRAAQLIGALLALLTTALLAGAAWNPLLVREQDPNRLHLAVVLDLSQSVVRPDETWPAVRDDVSRFLAQNVAALPDELRSEATASIIVFRNEAALGPPVESLEVLAERVRQVEATAIAGDGSDLSAGLAWAGEQITAAGGRGAVLLVSDGLQTEGDASQAASQLAQDGIPVLVYPLTSRGADLALISANLPRQTYAGDETLLRGVLWNGRGTPSTAELSVALNAGFVSASPHISSTARAEPPAPFQIASKGFGRLRAPIVFDGYGLQFADVTLSFDAQQGVQQRRFFTHVKRPLKLLAIGADQSWTKAFSEDIAQITVGAAGALSAAGDLRSYDGIVISAVAAQDFAPGELDAIRAAVQRSGVGLMLLNGDHGGNSEEAATVLKSYDNTPLDELLPVESGPRPFEEQPPSRHVVFLIDASGSMDGWPLAKAKEVAASIIERLMRPEDKVDIIAFNTTALHLVKNQATNDAGKKTALAQLASIQSGGSTDPRAALALVDSQQFDECGLIFLSDGGFETVAYRPDCHATVFAIGGDAGASSLRALADPFPVDPNFDPSAITIPYFSPQKRTKHWEVGEFTAGSLAAARRTALDLPVPAVPLVGSAISHVRDGAELVAVRPKLIDPVLAYRESELGYVGVLTTAVAPAWLEGEETRSAVRQWVSQIAPYTARDRYDFDLRDDGTRLNLRIALVQAEQRVPDVQNLLLQIDRPGQEPQPITVRADAGSPATFEAQITLPRTEQAEEVTLVVAEVGPDALARPQRIPLLIPSAGAVSSNVTAEAYSIGTNLLLLDQIAEVTGGRRLNPAIAEPLLTSDSAGRESHALWPWLLLLAALVYLAAIILRRADL